MKDTETVSSLESIKFIFRHPWAFIYPVVIVMSFAFAYLSLAQLKYECKAIIAFKAASSELIDEKFLKKSQDLIDNILIGDNIRRISSSVWPKETEETNPVRYNTLIERLRSPKAGIKMEYIEKGQHRRSEDTEFLNISFIDSSPNICYKVVQSTIEAIKRSNKEKVEEEIESGLIFLKKQTDFYMEKLRSIDEEMSRLTAELKRKYPELNAEERYLIDEILGLKAVDIKTEAKTRQLATYDEKLTELRLQLVELQKKKEEIQRRLRLGDLSPSTSPDKDIEDDPSLKGYSSAITAKELNMAELLSQGYMSEHPQIKKIRQEIENFKLLKERRIAELAGTSTLSKTAKTSREELFRKELKDLDAQISTTDIKIKTVEDYIQSFEKKLKPAGPEMSNISAQTLKYMELKSERDINRQYYNDTRQQLEAAQVRARIQKENAGLKISVVERPKIPFKPMPMQRIKMLFLALILAGSAGVGSAYLIDSFDTSIKSSSELREFLQVPVLASIDAISTPQEIKTRQTRRNMLTLWLIAIIVLSNILVRGYVLIFKAR